MGVASVVRVDRQASLSAEHGVSLARPRLDHDAESLPALPGKRPPIRLVSSGSKWERTWAHGRIHSWGFANRLRQLRRCVLIASRPKIMCPYVSISSAWNRCRSCPARRAGHDHLLWEQNMERSRGGRFRSKARFADAPNETRLTGPGVTTGRPLRRCRS